MRRRAALAGAAMMAALGAVSEKSATAAAGPPPPLIHLRSVCRVFYRAELQGEHGAVILRHPHRPSLAVELAIYVPEHLAGCADRFGAGRV